MTNRIGRRRACLAAFSSSADQRHHRRQVLGAAEVPTLRCAAGARRRRQAAERSSAWRRPRLACRRALLHLLPWVGVRSSRVLGGSASFARRPSWRRALVGSTISGGFAPGRLGGVGFAARSRATLLHRSARSSASCRRVAGPARRPLHDQNHRARSRHVGASNRSRRDGTPGCARCDHQRLAQLRGRGRTSARSSRRSPEASMLRFVRAAPARDSRPSRRRRPSAGPSRPSGPAITSPSPRRNTDLSSRPSSACTRSASTSTRIDPLPICTRASSRRPPAPSRKSAPGGHRRRRPRLRQVHLEALLHHRRRHHEDDEQHEHHVDERDDVDLRERRRLTRGAAPPGLVLLSRFRSGLTESSAS